VCVCERERGREIASVWDGGHILYEVTEKLNDIHIYL
jgi:hypothetical protein